MRLDIYGATSKLGRAEHHLKTLQTLLDTYVRHNSHRIETVAQHDMPGVLMLAYFDRPLPAEVPGIIGDILSNLRRSLDSVAIAAIRANRSIPQPGAHFPIADDQAKFEDQLATALTGAAASFVEEVRAMRPYLNDLDSRLYVLDHLLNIDQYAPMQPQVEVFAVLGLEVLDEADNVLMTMGEINTRGSQTINPSSLGGKSVRYGEKSSARFGVVFANTNFLDGHEVIAVLQELYIRVEEILAQFDGVAHGLKRA